jgi:phage regulator Rha-like protein
MNDIIQYIEDNKLNTKDRYRHLTYKRFYLYNLLRNEGHTLYEIAAMFNRDHASVIHGIKTHKDLISTKDKIYLDFVDELQLLFEGEPKNFNLVDDVLNCYSLERLKKIKFRIKNNLYI